MRPQSSRAPAPVQINILHSRFKQLLALIMNPQKMGVIHLRFAGFMSTIFSLLGTL